MWHYLYDDSEHGPVSDIELADLLKQGKLAGNSLVRRDNQDDWDLVCTFPSLRAFLPATSAPLGPVGGQLEYVSEANPFSYSDPAGQKGQRALQEVVDAQTFAKMEAIIRDSNQFLFAMLFSLFCVGIGFFITPLWYSMRLWHWKKLMAANPDLKNMAWEHGSVAYQFVTARGRIQSAIVFGALLPITVAVVLGLLLVLFR
jgi:hypothetical protein